MMSDQTDWIPEAFDPIVPRSIVAMPASGRSDLRGRRLLIGLPGLGWRTDLRGDSPVVQASRTYVPVLTEQEWYRAESEQIEVFAPLIPIDRVWAEVEDSIVPAEQIPQDMFGRLVSLDSPPRRTPIPARDVSRIMGHRLAQAEGNSVLRDLRAITEPYQNSDGDVCIRISTELDWYRWAWSGKVPKTREVPIFLLWAE